MGRKPIVVSAFDAELFGHWWYEGPQWLDFYIRKTAYDQSTVGLITGSGYLNAHPVHQTATPAMSSWGEKGFFGVWCNEKTDWVLVHVNDCIRRMVALCEPRCDTLPPPRIRRALNQCARELLLAQSSDWPFIMNNGTSVQYATRRVREHVGRFHYLADAIERNDIDEASLAGLEYVDSIFPAIDYRAFGKSGIETATDSAKGTQLLRTKKRMLNRGKINRTEYVRPWKGLFRA
jgi:1,4-alpha-glucan branching enzyme